MIKYLFIFALCVSLTPCLASEKEDSLKVETLLAAAQKLSADENAIIHFARQLKDLPYVAHTLEVNDTERLVVNLKQLDCTTYVENVLALTMCVRQGAYTFGAFRDNLAFIRYRSGSGIRYTTRLHYFTDWIEDNTTKGLCGEIQSPNPPFSATQVINVGYMSANPDKYKMLRDNPSDIPSIAESERALNGKTYKYIPKTAISNDNLLRSTIKDGDIIAITTTLKGLDIQHIGFAVWHDDGLHLLNASSIHHKVVEEPMTLRQYLLGKKSMTGVRIIRFTYQQETQ